MSISHIALIANMVHMLIPDYVAGIRLGRVHFPEALCHRRVMSILLYGR